MERHLFPGATFLRALIAFLVLPGTIAGLVPYLLFLFDPWQGEGHRAGLLVMAGGLFIIIWCVRDFYLSGKGTLAPWSPPQNLVIIGLYRFCRNPMYVGVVVLVLGWAIVAASPLLVSYWILLPVAFHLRVIFYEEKCLGQLFGPQWEEYRSSVPRWVPGIDSLRKGKWRY